MKNLMEFFTVENSYDDIMECLAITQTEVMKMADKLSLYKKDRTNLEQFVIFFDIVQWLMFTDNYLSIKANPSCPLLSAPVS